MNKAALLQHFENEERLLMPYMPTPIREFLASDHQRFKMMLALNQEIPISDLQAHAEFEELVEPRYVPDEVMNQLEDDGIHESIKERIAKGGCGCRHK